MAADIIFEVMENFEKQEYLVKTEYAIRGEIYCSA